MGRLKEKLPEIAVYILCAFVLLFLVSGIIEANKYKISSREYDRLSQCIKGDTDTYEEIESQAPATLPDVEIDIQKERIILPDIDFEKLAEINKDIVGWLYIPSVNISYPVVRSVDNIDYVTHTFYGTIHSAGCIFSDCRNNHPFYEKTILYGHNMKDGSMFHGLFTLQKEEYKASDVYILLPDYKYMHYKTVETKYTDIYDKDVYVIENEIEQNVLILSTCVNDEKRYIVKAIK